MLDHTDQPTKAEVEEMLTDFEAHELLSSRKDVYEFVGRVFKAYLAQDEELKGYKEENFELINYVTKLKAENLALLSFMETEYIERQARHIQELVEENLALKSSSYRVDQQDGE